MQFSFERFRDALADRYGIESEIGEGGMSTVYLAEDLKHHRKVAVKVLAPELVTTIGLARFLQEIELIAGLQHPNLLTLIDSGDVDGLPFYVMPFVEGQSLKEYLEREAPLPVDRAVAIAGEVLDGLAYAHARGVFHRDIKPSNVLMSGDHAIVADFGIAMALEKATVGRLTQMGASLGSPIYMSPEQAAGEHDLDARTDIYSMGCVLYEMLTGVAPIEDDSLQRALTQKMLGAFKALREHRSDVPAALDAAVAQALATDREERFGTADAFAEALARAVRPAGARVGPMGLAAAALVLLTLGGVGVAMARANTARALELSRDLAELERLADEGVYARAYELGERIAERAPDDTTLARIQPLFVDFIPIVTDPPGATVRRKRYGEDESTWETLGTTPLDVREVKWGNEIAHHYRFELEGHRPVDLLPAVFGPWAEWRGLEGWDRIRLDPVGVLPEGMVRVRSYSIADPIHADAGRVQAPGFFLDRTEVTNADFAEFVAGGGYASPAWWTEPFEKDGDTLSFEEALQGFTDKTGRPGPSTWELGTYPDGQGAYPVSGISWYEAMAYARFRGKVLPTSWHWWAAGIRHRRETAWIFQPTSHLNAAGPRAVGGTMEAFGASDLAGNVREWTFNRIGAGRIVRGGGWSDSEFHVGWRIERDAFDRSADNGMRLAVVSDDDTTTAHLRAPIVVAPPRDFRVLEPAPEAEVRAYLRQFDYDPAPLNTKEEEAVHTTEHYSVSRVTFDPAYEGLEMVAYVFKPLSVRPPYQPIVFWPGSGAMNERRFDPEAHVYPSMSFLLKTGRALVIPLYYGSFERDDPDFSTTQSLPSSTAYFRDLTVRWIKDFRRTVDWLESSPEMDAEAVGFYGISWGGQVAPTVVAAEPRVKAVALLIAGLWQGQAPPPEVEPFNYLPLVETPTIILNGRHDTVFPYETTQVPFFEHFGTPPEVVLEPTGHNVPQEVLVPAILEFFDRHLGPVRR